MQRSSLLKRKSWIWLAGSLCAILFASPLQPQHTGTSSPEAVPREVPTQVHHENSEATTQETTQERLESEPWWPTMSNAPLKAYAGSESCVKCHTEAAQSTSMRRAAALGSEDHFLKQDGAASLQSPPLSYRLQTAPGSLDYTVSSGGHTVTQKLAWVMGAGDLGRTFLYQADGHWQQSQMSYYTHTASLDITTGLGPPIGTGLAAALGQQLTAQEARACFSCHTVHATTSSGLEPLHAEPGIGCEACHGPAREHVTRMATASPETPARQASVFDPSKLSPEDSIDFCGSCHRSSADAKLSTTQDFRLTVVRFQPYRLQESKCWRLTKDERLTCVACHNPHKELNRDPVSYDRQCLQCHAATSAKPAPLHAGLICPKAQSNCVTCHMPKVTVPSMHGQFTDHYIRISRAGEPIPR